MVENHEQENSDPVESFGYILFDRLADIPPPAEHKRVRECHQRHSQSGRETPVENQQNIAFNAICIAEGGKDARHHQNHEACLAQMNRAQFQSGTEITGRAGHPQQGE